MLGYLEGWDKSSGPALRNPVNGDGWFPTGDIGVLEADGELRITGREKDIIIRGGVNVSAVEVERALDDADGVETLVVVGVPHEILGEQIAAVVATRDGVGLRPGRVLTQGACGVRLPPQRRMCTSTSTRCP